MLRILRPLITDRSNSLLNIFGLAISFACSFSLIAWINNEFSYDKHYPENDRIYRLTFETRFNGLHMHFARCWEPWVAQMPASFPQIEQLVRLSPYRHSALKIGENRFYSDNVFKTDSNFFKVFGLYLITGNEGSALARPFSTVITQSLARKCFGNKDPLGQTILMTGEYDTKMIPFTITGVMTDPPVNSHVHFDAVTSFEKPQEAPDWAYVYLLLKNGTSSQDIIAGFPSFLKIVEKEITQDDITPHLQKITDIHLHSEKDREIEKNGNISGVYLFIIVTLVLLVVSWVNFYNINKTRILSHRKSVQVQYILGAGNLRIINNFLAGSSIIVLSALFLAILLLDFSGSLVKQLPVFSLSDNGFHEFGRIWPFIAAILLASVIAGTMPAIDFILFNRKKLASVEMISVKIPKGITSYGILMAVQFCLSVILVAVTFTIYRQKTYILANSLGENAEEIIVLKRQNWEIRSKYNAIRAKALQNPLIRDFTAVMEEPSGETMDAMNVESAEIKDDLKDKPLYILPVEDNFLAFFNIRLIAGRGFSPFNPTREGEDYILNESAVRELGWKPEEAIGRPFKIKFDTPGIFYGGNIVGVVKDFNYTSLRQEIKPYVLFQKPLFYQCFLVKLDPSRKLEAINDLRKIWEQELPDYAFKYEFLNDLYKSSNQKEFTQSKLITAFSILAIVIICFGLFSLSSLIVARRTKEIGIRKVNGAGIKEILVMLNHDFVVWFLAAFIVACPIAYYLSYKWLGNFAYRAEIKWWIFFGSGLIVLSVTILTVTLQSLKAAAGNPVDALRYD